MQVAEQVLDYKKEITASFLANKVDATIKLIKQKPEFLSSSFNVKGATLLHLASALDMVEMADALIKAGADVNATMQQSSCTPLKYGIYKVASVAMMKLLINNQADMSIGKPLISAMKRKKRDILICLLKAGARRGAGRVLFDAVNQADVEIINLCIHKGIDFKIINSDKDSLFTCLAKSVCNKQHLIIAHKLMQYKHLLNLGDYAQTTPLHWAISSGDGSHEQRVQLIKLYINNQANISAKNSDGVTPLLTAAEYSTWPVVKLLIEQGANIAELDHYGRNILYYAIKNPRLDVLLYLVNYVDVYNKDNSADTLLHFACEHQNYFAIRVLLALGLDAGVKNSKGVTPLNKMEQLRTLEQGNMEYRRCLHLMRAQSKIRFLPVIIENTTSDQPVGLFSFLAKQDYIPYHVGVTKQVVQQVEQKQNPKKKISSMIQMS